MKIETLIVILAALMIATFAIFFFLPSKDQPTIYEKNVTIYQTFPREDSYMYHTPPYFTTMDGEIYDVNNDLLWAKLHQNETVTISWKHSDSERRTGEVVDIAFI